MVKLAFKFGSSKQGLKALNKYILKTDILNVSKLIKITKLFVHL